MASDPLLLVLKTLEEPGQGCSLRRSPRQPMMDLVLSHAPVQVRWCAYLFMAHWSFSVHIEPEIPTLLAAGSQLAGERKALVINAKAIIIKCRGLALKKCTTMHNRIAHVQSCHVSQHAGAAPKKNKLWKSHWLFFVTAYVFLFAGTTVCLDLLWDSSSFWFGIHFKDGQPSGAWFMRKGLKTYACCCMMCFTLILMCHGVSWGLKKSELKISGG